MPTNPTLPPAQGHSSAALTDPVLMREAGPELLSLALMEARNHTLRLFSQFEKTSGGDENLTPEPLWTLGRIGWFQEWWIGRNLQRALGPHGAALQSRLASIEPEADRWWQAPPDALARSALAAPDVASCRAYLLDTLESTLELLEKTARGGPPPTDDALYFYRLCLFHEDMQAEVLTRGLQTLGVRIDKALHTALTPPPLFQREPLLVPACVWQQGSATGEGGFTFDNESPPRAVSVPEFEIDAQPVTWSQYVEFVGDGGYDDATFWSPEGWAWLQAQAAGEGRRGPRHVEQIGVASGAVMQTRFGLATRMLGNQPALHVRGWEAEAWCRWAGRRLPTEVEWEVAAHTAVRRGFRSGDVWEWTGTTFRAYPGFEPGPWAEYSQPAFGSHKVLRGGSFATRGRLKHPKFRAFELPGCDDIFAGFRSCAL